MEKKSTIVKFFGEKRNGKGELLERKQIGTARVCILNNKGYTVKPQKYNQLKHALFEAFPERRKGTYTRIVDEAGRKDTFGGYPTKYCVWFE